MQLYADGKLVEDDFYHGMPWRLPKKLITNDAYIVVSDANSDIYLEKTFALYN